MSMVLVVGACMPHMVPPSQKFEVAKQIINGTAALVATDEDGDTSVYCTAVFIGTDNHSMISAAHCVVDPDEPTKNLIGGKIKYVVQSEITGVRKNPVRTHEATIVKIDVPHDLVLLKTGDDVPLHYNIVLAALNPQVSEELYAVGHKVGYTYSFYKVTVAAFRDQDLRKEDGKLGPYLEINGDVFFGCSGGGVFNDNGALVGIASFITRAPAMGMYIRLETISNFLAKK